MKIVLLSGGAGKRLYPLSNNVRAKQFLRLFKGETEQKISMIQRVWQQLQSAGLRESSYISTNKGQVNIIQSQLQHPPPLIVEPELRDTFPSVSLLSSYLYSEEMTTEDEIICVVPVDAYVNEEYFHKLRELEHALQKSGNPIGLLGVTPTHPSERFGYIVPKGSLINSYYQVDSFSEKPNKQTALELIDKGALWNCGVFAFRLGYMIDILRDKHLPQDYKTLSELYATLPKQSFDYEVLEHEKHCIVVPYEGEWKDLGDWQSLTEELGTSVLGKGYIDSTSKNTHIINELEIPIVTLGLEDSIVAASPDGILVSKKPISSKVKEIVEFNKSRPMYEERLWGWYRVLDFEKKQEGREILTKRLCIRKGKNLSYQVHNNRNEVWTIISGSGDLVLNNQRTKVYTGDVVQIKAGDKHALKADVDLELIEVQTGSELIEEDIERLCLTWDEVESYIAHKQTH